MRAGGRLVFLSFALLILLVVAWYIRHALLLLYVSGVFAVVLKPAVDRVQKMSIFGRHLGRGSALLLLVLALALVLVVVGIFAVPPLLSDLTDFIATLPRTVEQLLQKLRSIPLLRNVDRVFNRACSPQPVPAFRRRPAWAASSSMLLRRCSSSRISSWMATVW